MDAVHIATALDRKCTHFLTTDEKIGEQNIKKIGGLGLTVCKADQIADLLPAQYNQFRLPAIQPSGDQPPL